MRTALYIALIASMATLLAAPEAAAQCKKFVKKNCPDYLAGYTNDGSQEGEQLFQGEWREYPRTFYGGLDYRVAVCFDEKIAAEAYWVLQDVTTGKVYFDSRESDSEYFDFNVSSGINLDVKVTVPEGKDKRGFTQMGCAVVMVGFKP